MDRRSTMQRGGGNGRPARARRGFSMVELLVVIGLVIVLLSILAIALNVAKRSSQKANTQTLMNSIKQGLVQFKSDVGYLPPVLDQNRNLAWQTMGDRENGPDLELPDDDYYSQIQDWVSITTLAEYLIGYGSAIEDGCGPNNPLQDPPSDPPLGIRHPGPDGYWSTVNQSPRGQLDGRMSFLGNPGTNPGARRFLQGRVLGPYIELKDPRLLGAINPDEGPAPDGSWRVFFPGEAGYDPPNPDDPRVMVLCDYWGQPLRFYRRPHPPGAIGQDYRPGMVNTDGVELRMPSLSDVFVLRPYNIPPGQEVDGVPDENPGVPGGDTTTTLALQSAEFAILSAGPDRRLTANQRVDTDEFNADNIVEVGP